MVCGCVRWKWRELLLIFPQKRFLLIFEEMDIGDSDIEDPTSCVSMMDTLEEGYFDWVLRLLTNITFLAVAVRCSTAIFQQIEVEPPLGECH